MQSAPYPPTAIDLPALNLLYLPIHPPLHPHPLRAMGSHLIQGQYGEPRKKEQRPQPESLQEY